METRTNNQEHAPLVQVKPRACDCPTAFFYSRLPCMSEPHNYTGGTNNVFMFHDAVGNKANSDLYALDTDGALLIKTGGTYFATVMVDMAFNGDVTNAAVSATIVVETPSGYVPYQNQQIPVIMEPLTAEHAFFNRGIFHANAVIHVDDTNFGTSSPSARVFLWLSVDGTIEYTPNIEFTVRN